MPLRFDLAATWLEQETAGFIIGQNAYRDDDVRDTNPNPEAFRNASAVRLTGALQPQTSLPGQLDLRPYLRTSRMEFLQHFLLGQPLERNGQESAGVMSSFAWDTGTRTSLDHRPRPRVGRFVPARGAGCADHATAHRPPMPSGPPASITITA